MEERKAEIYMALRSDDKIEMDVRGLAADVMNMVIDLAARVIASQHDTLEKAKSDLPSVSTTLEQTLAKVWAEKEAEQVSGDQKCDHEVAFESSAVNE